MDIKVTEKSGKYEKLELTRPRIKIKRHESQLEADPLVEVGKIGKYRIKNDEDDAVSKSTMNMIPTRASLQQNYGQEQPQADSDKIEAIAISKYKSSKLRVKSS